MTRVFSAFLAMAALATFSGCDDPPVNDTERAAASCSDYCAARESCDASLDEGDCNARCVDTMTNCEGSVQQGSLDDLDACANETCDDIGSCGVGEMFDCTFTF